MDCAGSCAAADGDPGEAPAEWASLVLALEAEAHDWTTAITPSPIRRKKSRRRSRRGRPRSRSRGRATRSATRSPSPAAAPAAAPAAPAEAAVAAPGGDQSDGDDVLAPTRWPHRHLIRSFRARKTREARRRDDEAAVESRLAASVSVTPRRRCDKAHERPLPHHVGYDAQETRVELEARLGRRVALAEARSLMRDAHVNQMGCISEPDLATLVHHQRRADRGRRASRWKLAWAADPRERYESSALDLDRRALSAPLGRPLGVDWQELVFMPDGHRDFARAAAHYNDATLTRATILGRNTLLHYLANFGHYQNLREVLVRNALRDLVDKRNGAGFTALDFAVASSEEEIIDTLSAYHAEHLAGEHLSAAHRRHLDRNTRFSRRSVRVSRK